MPNFLGNLDFVTLLADRTKIAHHFLNSSANSKPSEATSNDLRSRGSVADPTPVPIT